LTDGKQIGPGHYNPQLEKAKKNAPAYDFHTSKTTRDETTIVGNTLKE